MQKYLGKISSVHFGLCGYQDAMLGISFNFRFDGSSGVGTCDAFWDFNMIEHSPHCQWTEQERDNRYCEIMKNISCLLSQAKVKDVNDLKGKPVELTLDGNSLKDWRILTEVL